MAIGNFAACLAVTLKHEGGWSDHPADPGGATMKGVTIGRYREYYPNATKADLKKISEADLQRIYRNDYWNKVRGENLPFGVDLATFDFGVNSGPSRGVKYLQAVVGAKQDGVAGSETISKVQAMDGKAVVQKLCAKRLGFLHGLSTFKTFGKGWSRRVADIEAKAVAMWLTRGTGKLSETHRKEMQKDAASAGNKAVSQDKSAKGTAGGGGVVGGIGAGDAITNGAPNWIVIGIAALIVIGGVALYIKSRQNKERASAYAAVAAG